jgi:hypothetical protein
MVYLFLFTLAPLAIWVGYQEGVQGDEYLAVFQSLESERAHEGENIDLDLDIASEEQWQQLSAEEKFVEVSKLVDYECAKLNVGSMDIFAVKDNMNGRLAYYDCETEKVCFNIAYLQNSATLVDAIHIVAHECYHRYTDKVVESLDYLESANMNYEALEYFQDAIVLRDAYNNYYMDHLSEETYRQNELEVRADKYAETETELLKKELGL